MPPRPKAIHKAITSSPVENHANDLKTPDKTSKSDGTLISEVERDFPGRFMIDGDKLERLTEAINRSLQKDDDTQRISLIYWVRLENGIISSYDNLNELLRSEENFGIYTIRLLVIYGELFDKENNSLKRIVIQFSRGKSINNTFKLEYIEQEAFNLNYRGMNYRVRARDRKTAVEIINLLEERLSHLRIQSGILSSIILRPLRFTTPFFLIFILNIMLYALSWFSHGKFLPSFFNSTSPNTADFLMNLVITISIVLVIYVFLILLFYFFNWILPPTYIGVGDEIENYKKQKNLREIVLVSVVLALIVGVLSNFLKDFIAQLFGSQGGGAGR